MDLLIFNERRFSVTTNNTIWYKHESVLNSSFKVGLSPSKKICVICFIESPLKMIKNAFYFILKALFVLKIFKFLSWLFGHVGEAGWLGGGG